MLEKRFGISSTLYNDFDTWARLHPDLVTPDEAAGTRGFGG